MNTSFLVFAVLTTVIRGHEAVGGVKNKNSLKISGVIRGKENIQQFIKEHHVDYQLLGRPDPDFGESSYGQPGHLKILAVLFGKDNIQQYTRDRGLDFLLPVELQDGYQRPQNWNYLPTTNVLKPPQSPFNIQGGQPNSPYAITTPVQQQLHQSFFTSQPQPIGQLLSPASGSSDSEMPGAVSALQSTQTMAQTSSSRGQRTRPQSIKPQALQAHNPNVPSAPQNTRVNLDANDRLGQESNSAETPSPDAGNSLPPSTTSFQDNTVPAVDTKISGTPSDAQPEWDFSRPYFGKSSEQCWHDSSYVTGLVN